MLPALMTGVDSKVWRAKQGSVQMLGAMAHLAPGPLSTALPRIVPQLSQVLSDPHPKVQARRSPGPQGGALSDFSVCVLGKLFGPRNRREVHA